MVLYVKHYIVVILLSFFTLYYFLNHIFGFLVRIIDNQVVKQKYFWLFLVRLTKYLVRILKQNFIAKIFAGVKYLF